MSHATPELTREIQKTFWEFAELEQTVVRECSCQSLHKAGHKQPTNGHRPRDVAIHCKGLTE